MIWVLFEGQHKYLWTDTVIIIKSFYTSLQSLRLLTETLESSKNHKLNESVSLINTWDWFFSWKKKKEIQFRWENNGTVPKNLTTKWMVVFVFPLQGKLIKFTITSHSTNERLGPLQNYKLIIPVTEYAFKTPDNGDFQELKIDMPHLGEFTTVWTFAG